MISKTETDPAATVTLTVLKAANAPKLSKRSAGKHVHYRLWTDDQRSDVWWQIAANDGGGQHSLELVPTRKVLATLDALAGRDPFRTKNLRGAFQGRSANNPGFLVCALYAEGLVQASDKANHHVLSDIDWNTWRDTCLALPGQPVEVAATLALSVLPADTSAPVPKGRRFGKHKAQPEDEAHAGAA
jgi:hypothetical protein